MSLLEQTIDAVVPVTTSLAIGARKHLANLTKPEGSLGKLEDLAVSICKIQHTLAPVLGAKRIYVFAGDHGVAEENVSAFPKAVTSQMVRNMVRGGAAINVLGRHAHSEVYVVDVGVDATFERVDGLMRRKVRLGTDNITKGPAMSVEEATHAVEVGIEMALGAHNSGIVMLGTGDMGIANTTASSALMAVLLPCEVNDIVGRGTGIDDVTLQRKRAVVKKALSVNSDRIGAPLETLAALGGLEIAGIAGLVLGAASKRISVIVDGFISSAGALVACRMAPAVKDYLFFSHCSAEAGHRQFFRTMAVAPLLHLGLRLGEGTGAALAMHLLDAGVKIYREMATFNDADVAKRES
jgi:nicotinate-nucleotide--dimethylbenzimidazole phosphoribosyltransferase